jgi:hypothetical protein
LNLVDLYLSYVEPLKGSTRYHRWSIISVISALLERRVWLDRGRFGVLFPNTYTILVGPPAAGKSTAAGIAADLFDQVKPAGKRLPHKGPTKITQAALYKELHDAERLITIPGQPSSRQSPMFVYASELAINIAEFGGGSLTNELIDFYDSKGHNITVGKRTIADDTLQLFNPSITLLGCTTTQFLQKAASESLITSGLASRIVFVVEDTYIDKQRESVGVDKIAYKSLTIELERIYQMRGQMQFDNDAYRTYVKYAEAADRQCYASGQTELYQNYFGRKPDHIAKIAICFAAVHNRYTITVADIELARTWIEDLEADMIKAFGIRNIEDDADFSIQIMSAIPHEPIWSTRSEVLSKLMRYGKFVSTGQKLKDTLESLAISKSIKVAPLPNDIGLSRCNIFKENANDH